MAGMPSCEMNPSTKPAPEAVFSQSAAADLDAVLCQDRRRLMKVLACRIGGVSLLLMTAVVVDAQSPQTGRRVGSQVEEIYIARSVPDAQIPPTEFCAPAKTGFGDAMAEYRFSFRSVSTNTSDARLLNSIVKSIGSFHGCFGPTANPMSFNAFAEDASDSRRLQERANAVM